MDQQEVESRAMKKSRKWDGAVTVIWDAERSRFDWATEEDFEIFYLDSDILGVYEKGRRLH